MKDTFEIFYKFHLMHLNEPIVNLIVFPIKETA